VDSRRQRSARLQAILRRRVEAADHKCVFGFATVA
jgi:hypothetical protein